MLIFVRLIFVATIDYENIFTMKISRFTHTVIIILYLEVRVFQSILGSDSLLWVVSEESVEQIESVLCEKRRRELLPQVIVGLVSKGHLHKEKTTTKNGYH